MTPKNQDPQSPDIFRRLHRQLALLIRKNRFIRKLTHTGLTRPEIHVLIETQAHGVTSVTVLRPMLGLDQSSVSRLIKSLMRKGLILSEPSRADKRVKQLKLTKQGTETIKQIDEIAGAIFDSFKKNITTSEVEKLRAFFHDIANYYGQPITQTRFQESGLRTEQRRMSRALGVLSSNIFESELTATQWHVFREICRCPYPLHPTQLCETNNIPANSLSIILDKLEQSELVVRDAADHDYRYIELKATEHGVKFLEEVEKEAARDLRQLTGHFERDELLELEAILLKYLGNSPAKENLKIPDTYTVRSARSNTSRQQLRAFTVTEMVQNRQEMFCPERLIAEDSLSYGLYEGQEKLVASCEIDVSIEPARLTCYAAAKNISSELLYAFLEFCMKTTKKRQKITNINIAFQPALRLFQKTA